MHSKQLSKLQINTTRLCNLNNSDNIYLKNENFDTCSMINAFGESILFFFLFSNMCIVANIKNDRIVFNAFILDRHIFKIQNLYNAQLPRKI